QGHECYPVARLLPCFEPCRFTKGAGAISPAGATAYARRADLSHEARICCTRGQVCCAGRDLLRSKTICLTFPAPQTGATNPGGATDNPSVSGTKVNGCGIAPFLDRGSSR